MIASFSLLTVLFPSLQSVTIGESVQRVSITSTLEGMELLRTELYDDLGRPRRDITSEFVVETLSKQKYVPIGQAGNTVFYADSRLPQIRSIFARLELLDAIANIKPDQLILANSSQQAKRVANQLATDRALVVADGNPGFMVTAQISFVTAGDPLGASFELGKPNFAEKEPNPITVAGAERSSKFDVLIEHPFVSYSHPKYANKAPAIPKPRGFGDASVLIHLNVRPSGTIADFVPQSALNQEVTKVYANFLTEQSAKADKLIEAYFEKFRTEIFPLKYGVETDRDYSFSQLPTDMQRQLRVHLLSTGQKFTNVAEEDAYLRGLTGRFVPVLEIRFCADQGNGRISQTIIPLRTIFSPNKL